MPRAPLAAMALALSSIAIPAALADVAQDLDKARQLAQVGRYGQAKEAFEAIKTDDPALAARRAIGLADSLAAVGEYSPAREALARALEAAPDSAPLAAALGELEFRAGRWDEASELARKAMATEPENLGARWLAARLLEARGKHDEALVAYQSIVDLYNANRKKLAADADALCLVGQAAERYYRARARGPELGEQLNDVLNELYEKAIKLDPKCWQAAWLEGRLFLSGYREGSARKELNRALAINPSAVEAIVNIGQAELQGYKLAVATRKAEEALEVNPRYAPAHILMADAAISDERFDDALKAAKLAVTEMPKDEEALARLAAAYRLLVDPVGAAAVEAAVLQNNPKPAAFYAALGERLADRRKYHSAERAFLQSIAADPEHADSRIGLGMLYMQIGREPEARELFQAAFDADPYNVRAENMMKVLKRMEPYESLDSDHYRLLTSAPDKLLGRYMSKYLESIYGDMTRRFGYAPPGKTQIEILEDQETFSGRTVGVRFIPTVGACTGKVVALASPRAGRQPYNWSRVLTHELAHVITLQQTDFNIPHWYTEALAVESENAPRPQPWNKMLMERIPARKLLNLDNINLGFIRPREPEERQLAYCQAQLYAQYMLKRFGEDALIKMLDAYRQGLTTEKAIGRCFNVEKADFEAGYLAFLDDVLKTIRTRADDEKKVPFSQLDQMLKAKPDDADLNARMAYEHFSRRDLKQARPFADKALKLKPNHPLAGYVKARLLQAIGDDDGALEVLKPALDPARPNERVIDLLAELLMKADDLQESERLYELARKDDPFQSKWIAGLARVHMRQERPDKLLEDLAMLAANDADDLAVRKALAERHLARDEFEQAEKWATECLYIQVYDAAYHDILADARAGRKDWDGAIEEYQVALTLKPRKPNDLKVKLARALNGKGDAEGARKALDEVLQADPEHPGALELKKTLE
ncbi:MAG: tetratricopeptide repeat protein [Isosphaeraceae bacterium]